MSVKFFGQYLIDKKIITSSELLQALGLQEKNNRRFGKIVRDMGIMTVEQVRKVHDAQRTNDLMFGEMAMLWGYLTSEQIEMTLKIQSGNHLYIGEALIELGILTSTQLVSHLEDFKQKCSLQTSQEISLLLGKPHREILVIILDMFRKMLIRFAHVPCQFGQAKRSNRVPSRSVCFAASFSGDVEFRLIISMDENNRDYLISGLVDGVKFQPNSEQVKNETLLEFIDLIYENFSRKCDQLGHSVNVEKAEIGLGEDIEIGESEAVLNMKIGLPEDRPIDFTMVVLPSATTSGIGVETIACPVLG